MAAIIPALIEMFIKSRRGGGGGGGAGGPQKTPDEISWDYAEKNARANFTKSLGRIGELNNRINALSSELERSNELLRASGIGQ